VPLFVAIPLTLSLTVLSAMVGIHIGRSQRATVTDSEREQIHRIAGSLLGLFALLLGFSFIMAETRFDLRKQLVVEEANAVGTTRLRAGTVADERGRAIQRLLDQYVTVRLRGYAAANPAALQAAIDESVRLQDEVWLRVAALARDDPRSLPVSLLVQSTNELIDLHATRVAAGRNHIPTAVLAMLFIVSVLTMGWVGASIGVSHRHGTTTAILLSLIVALVIGAIIDLDAPRAGLIRVSQAALLDLQHSLH
jgi:hypothetical protein